MDVDFERYISIRIKTGFLSVYPDFCLVISSFKIKGNNLIGIFRLYGEFFSIPSFTSYGLSGICSAYTHARERTDCYTFSLYGHRIHAPVMRQVELSPLSVFERCLFGIGNATPVKLPVLIHTDFAFRCEIFSDKTGY